MKYASIVVDITSEKLDRAFQYRIPSQWEQELEVGMVVTVPFGKGDREINGYVVELTDTPQFDVEKLKCIRSITAGCRSVIRSLCNLIIRTDIITVPVVKFMRANRFALCRKHCVLLRRECHIAKAAELSCPKSVSCNHAAHRKTFFFRCFQCFMQI